MSCKIVYGDSLMTGCEKCLENVRLSRGFRENYTENDTSSEKFYVVAGYEYFPSLADASVSVFQEVMEKQRKICCKQ